MTVKSCEYLWAVLLASLSTLHPRSIQAQSVPYDFKALITWVNDPSKPMAYIIGWHQGDQVETVSLNAISPGMPDYLSPAERARALALLRAGYIILVVTPHAFEASGGDEESQLALSIKDRMSTTVAPGAIRIYYEQFASIKAGSLMDALNMLILQCSGGERCLQVLPDYWSNDPIRIGGVHKPFKLSEIEELHALQVSDHDILTGQC